MTITEHYCDRQTDARRCLDSEKEQKSKMKIYGPHAIVDVQRVHDAAMLATTSKVILSVNLCIITITVVRATSTGSSLVNCAAYQSLH